MLFILCGRTSYYVSILLTEVLTLLGLNQSTRTSEPDQLLPVKARLHRRWGKRFPITHLKHFYCRWIHPWKGRSRRFLLSHQNREHKRNKKQSKYFRQPRLRFYSVLVSVSVFMTLSTVFHVIHSSEHSPLSHSVLPVFFLPSWSFQLYISGWKSPSALI